MIKLSRILGLGALAGALLTALVLVLPPLTAQPRFSNNVQILGANSGSNPSLRAVGADANISLNLVSKGGGCVQINGVCATVSGGTFTSLTINPGPLAVTGTTNLTGPLFATPGTSTALEQVGAIVLANSSTTATTTLVATEQDLFNFSIPANTLSANNQYLVLSFRDRNAATANTKQLRVYFGATTIGDSTAVAANNNWWNGDCIIWRTGAATQKAICTVLNGANGGSWSQAAGAGNNLSTPAENTAGAITIRITGTDAVAAGGSNLEGVNLVWYPAGQ
jgi:hypothetical protein